jgi:hypothetical protein
MLVSQPLAKFPSQSPQPELHEPTLQALFWQTTEFALTGIAHTLLQAPQLEALLVVLVSQPLALLPSQLPHPALQAATVQTLFWHEGVALDKKQAAPQEPQLLTLLEKSRQAPLQLGVNSPTHVPKPLPSGEQVLTPLLQIP